MLTKEELKELNLFLFDDIKNTSYAISKTNLFYIDNGELFQKENLTKHNNDFKKVCPKCDQFATCLLKDKLRDDEKGCPSFRIGKPISKS